MNPKTLLAYYKRQYSQCTHIIGNLVLCNLKRLEDGSDPDLSFLNSIREVSGYVYIGNNEVKRIPLISLRIIRGRVPYHVGNVGDGALIVTRNAKNYTHGLEVLDLRSLAVIQEHNIIAWDNPMLCHFQYTVDCPQLFVDVKNQRRLSVSKENLISGSGCDYDTDSPMRRNTTCHSACSENDEKGHCWGPEKNQCQLRSKCTKESTTYCRLDNPFERIKCDDACIGGCNGSTSNCWACRSKRNGDTCVSFCPPRHHVNPTTSRQELNPDFKYELHDICVRQCPEPLLKMDTVCVIECDFKTTIPVNGSCVPCAKTPCANHCEQKDIFGSRFPLMTSEAAKRMSQCVFYSGAIYINKDSFKVTLKRPGLQIEDLWNLHNIREIVGYIYLDLDASSPELRNLTFLENLYKVTTEFSDGVSLDQPLVIYHSKYLEFLGLKSLRYMDMTAYLEALPSLCYTSALEKILPVRTKGVKDSATCIQEGHVCHSECLPEAGCWGPGPAMCAHCCTFEADGVCVSDCSEAPGFYLPPSSAVSTLTSKFRCHTLPLSMKQVAQMQEEEVLAAIRPAVKCARCHEECAESCTAPGPDQCLGECKHFKSGDTCVKRCSKEQYAEEKQKLCQPCSSKCLASLKSKFPPDDISACSGPGDYLGLGGCAFCYFVKKDKATSKYQCLDMKCPPKHFGNATSLTYLNLKKEEFPLVSMRAANADLQECVPCHPECEVCVGPGNHVSVCRKCRNWMYRSECVNACPPDDTYVPNATATEHLSEREKQMLERRECLRCHEQCAGGCTAYGPEFCNNCRYAKIMIDVQANKFICNSTCPPELYKMENTNLCLDEEQYEKMSGAKMARARNQALIAAGIVLLFLLIFSLVLAVLCFNYKAKRSRIKEALKSTYTNIKAPDMKDAKSSREPNMGRWEMINIDDLTFDDANNPIGRGAFGEVYRGKWRVPKRVLNQFNWARNTSLDVAIKVIRSAAPTAQGGAASNLGASGLDSNVSTVASSQLGANTIDRISARSNLQDMLTEAKVMASVQHKNCLPLIGVCLTRKMQCMVSMFVEEGSLDRYLRLHKDDLNSFTLLSWAEQIADGMAYLEERGIIHRDLAARNVLVQSRELVQITDFGLAKMLDTNDEDSVVVRTGRVPIRWLAIETLQAGIYSHKTDVWSYGVTLWEIFTFGKQPYENISTSEIKDHVMKGVRLSQPEICTLDTYMVMVQCWMEEHESRPTFLELMKCFHKYCQTPGRYLYIEGDEYAITRASPYTPSPAPWTEMKPLPSSFRGVPDGTLGPPNGTGYAFRFPEEHFFDDHQRHLLGETMGEGSGNPEAESLLPQRAGNDHHHHHRRFFSHSNETRMRQSGRQERAPAAGGGASTNTSVVSTNLDSWPTGSGMGSNAAFPVLEHNQNQQQQPKYYNTAFLASGTYGPLVRPPSPPPAPPPLAQVERDDDLDTMGSGIKDAEINYLSTLEMSMDGVEGAGGGEQSLQPEDYLEPRASADGKKRSGGFNAVGNPDYLVDNQGYFQPAAFTEAMVNMASPRPFCPSSRLFLICSLSPFLACHPAPNRCLTAFIETCRRHTRQLTSLTCAKQLHFY
uniref:receptor protein-tyrosine kinase n=1 Tax=Echinococcus granulosus TaxID=6210 RepID=A0A068WQ46_ECHGR|nr:epidermal growth factor receptor [Echinococcus granulosus]